MKRSRFFEGSSHKADALRLANRIQTGDLPRASASVRAVALANCARYLARDDDVSVAEGLLGAARSEAHTSELQSLMRISYAVFCLKTTPITYQTVLNRLILIYD